MAKKGRPLDMVKVDLLVGEIRAGGNIKQAYLRFTPKQIKEAKKILNPLTVKVSVEEVTEVTQA